MIDQREAIAYHEAGHAVVSMKLGYKCLYVTIIPDGSRLGHVCCEDPLIGGHDDKIKHALKVLLGARLAEGRHVGSPTWGDADERVKATNLALLATDRDTERAETLINEMIQETRKLVEQSLARDRSAGKAVTRQATGQLLRDLRELQLLTKKTCASRETPLRLLISEDLPSPLAHDPDYDGCWQLSWDLKKSRKERRSGRVGAAMADWTAERIAALPTAQIKILRENAARCANDTVAALCDEAIAKRG
ncbi:MAG: hypothetical protein ACLQF1_19110, partial [Methyloceanibacter sp.]